MLVLETVSCVKHDQRKARERESAKNDKTVGNAETLHSIKMKARTGGGKGTKTHL